MQPQVALENGIGRARELASNVNPRTAGLAMILLGSLAVAESEYARSLPHLLDLMASGMLAIPTWELPTHEGLTQMLQHVEGRREVAKFIAIDAGYLVLARYGLHHLLDKLPDRIGENKRLGLEPLKKKEKPSHVIIGPSQIASDIAQTIAAYPNMGLIVGVHLDDELPETFGQEMGYHLRAHNLSEIVGRHAATTKRNLSFIEASGIDRSDKILIASFNPDNALFYGEDSNPQIPSGFVSTLLRNIPAEKVKGKKVAVVLSGDTYFGETTPIERELDQIAQELGFDLEIINPEGVVLEEIKRKLETIKAEKTDGSRINIVFAGEGRTDVDMRMNERFARGLEVALSDDNVAVSIVNHHRVGDLTASPDDTEGYTQRQTVLPELLQNADLTICYGDTDTGTSTVHALALAQGAKLDNTWSLVERTSNVPDFYSRGFQYIPIYQQILLEAA